MNAPTMQQVNRFAAAPGAAGVVANLGGAGAGAAVGIPGGQQDAGMPQQVQQPVPSPAQQQAGPPGLVQPGSQQQNQVQPQQRNNSLFFNLFLLKVSIYKFVDG